MPDLESAILCLEFRLMRSIERDRKDNWSFNQGIGEEIVKLREQVARLQLRIEQLEEDDK